MIADRLARDACLLQLFISGSAERVSSAGATLWFRRSEKRFYCDRLIGDTVQSAPTRRIAM